MKQQSITLKWPIKKVWILEALEKIVEKKEKIGIKSSVSSEISRIVENYMTGTLLGKSFDKEVLASIFSDVINKVRNSKTDEPEPEDT